MRLPVLFDCDPGLDDAIALVVLAARQDLFDVKGITTLSGNQSGDKTFRNARRIGAHLGLQVPVAKGAEHPLVFPPYDSGDVHGEDGLAGMEVGDKLLPASPLSAVAFLKETLQKAEEPLDLIAVGPLTNLALLFREFPEGKEKIRRLTIMGGSLSGGNVSPYGEFNFFADPHAADEVLHAGVPVTLFGLDVTHKAGLTDEELSSFSALGTKRGKMVGDLIRFYGAVYRSRGFTITPVHDATAVLSLACPSLFSGKKLLHLDVVTEGERRGECTVSENEAPNVTYVTEVDRDEFVRTLFDCCKA